MHSSPALLFFVGLLSTASAQTSSCIYAAVANFPTTGVCYPTNYYAAQDQGQFSGSNGDFATQLMAKCRATCDSQPQCLSFTGPIFKAADSNLATGTCFYYSTQQVSPRQCADSPSQIIAYFKQNSVNGVCSATTVTSSSSTTRSTTSSSSTTTKSSTTTSSTTKSSTTSSSSTTTRPSTTSSSSTSSRSTTSSSTSSRSTTSSSTSSSTTSSRSTTSSSTSSSTSTPSSTSSSSTSSRSTTSSSTSSSTTSTPSSTSSSSTSSSTTSSSTTSTPSTTSSSTTSTPSSTSSSTTSASTTIASSTSSSSTSSSATSTSTDTTSSVMKTCTNNGAGTEQPNQCGTAGANCGCYLDAEGGGYCALYYGTCDQECTTHADCAGTQRCINASSTGCGGNGNVCSGSSDSDQCNTGVSRPMMLFKPRGMTYTR